MTPEALQVARDALLEAGSIADVLDLARTMALERLARGLPVAWVGPVSTGARVLHVWVAEMASPDVWRVRRDGEIVRREQHDPEARTFRRVPVAWSQKVVAGRVTRAIAVLDAASVDAVWMQTMGITRPMPIVPPGEHLERAMAVLDADGRPRPPHPTIGPEPRGAP